VTGTLGIEPASCALSAERGGHTRRAPRRHVVVALLVLITVSCAHAPADAGSTHNGGADNTNHDQAVKFAECMRRNGVTAFPDPDPSGSLRIDGIANGSSVDPGTATFTQALSACQDLQPAGFMGPGEVSPEQQDARLKFAQCIRDNGVPDFPDPARDAPLVDTNRIPSSATKGGMSTLNAAMKTCGDLVSDALGDK
jgi:hypothetical protein